jgi:hypothetical protein
VLAIVITAPLGAILINTLGVKWLSNENDTESETKLNQVAIIGETPTNQDGDDNEGK